MLHASISDIGVDSNRTLLFQLWFRVGGYIFEGRLTVTTVEDGVKKSEFYYFNVGFDKTTEKERNGTTIQFLEATSGLGTFSFIPGIDYKIINATLLVDKKSPSLTIYGERPTTEHY